MITFRLSILLYAYFAYVFFWTIFFLVGIFHLLKFGFKNIVTLASLFIFVTAAVFMLAASLQFIGVFDWNEEAVLFEAKGSGADFYLE